MNHIELTIDDYSFGWLFPFDLGPLLLFRYLGNLRPGINASDDPGKAPEPYDIASGKFPSASHRDLQLL